MSTKRRKKKEIACELERLPKSLRGPGERALLEEAPVEPICLRYREMTVSECLVCSYENLYWYFFTLYIMMLLFGIGLLRGINVLSIIYSLLLTIILYTMYHTLTNPSPDCVFFIPRCYCYSGEKKRRCVLYKYSEADPVRKQSPKCAPILLRIIYVFFPLFSTALFFLLLFLLFFNDDGKIVSLSSEPGTIPLLIPGFQKRAADGFA